MCVCVYLDIYMHTQTCPCRHVLARPPPVGACRVFRVDLEDRLQKWDYDLHYDLDPRG